MNKRLRTKALAHYDKMITWVEAQNPRGEVSNYEMELGINEGWYDNNCSYCAKYEKGCAGCELLGNDISSIYGEVCCDGLWEKMSTSKTWRGWLKYAKQVRAYIENNG